MARGRRRCTLLVGDAAALLRGRGADPVSRTAFKGFADGAQALLEAGAKLTVRDTNGRTPLHLCTNSSASKCMAVLLNDPKRDYIDLQDNEGMTALHWAGFHKMPNHTQALLRKGEPPPPPPSVVAIF